MTNLSPPLNYDENKVAIIVPLYNDAAHIARAIESAMSQEMPEGSRLEILIADDCSSDGGAAIAEDYARRFANVSVFRLPVNRGPSAARNAALRETDAAWFSPLDSDDLMRPTRIARLLARAREGGYDIVADNLLITDSSAPEAVVRELWPEKPRGDIPLTAELFLRQSINVETPRSELGYVKPLIHRRLIQIGAAAYRDDLRFGEDFELYVRMLLDGAKAVLVDPEGYYFVGRDGSASRSQGKEDHQKLARISRSMLKRKTMSPSERDALERHARYFEREWASWEAIEGLRSRSLSTFMKAFSVSLPASIFVVRRLMAAAAKKVKGAFS